MGAGCRDKVVSSCMCDLAICVQTADSRGKKTLGQL